MFRFIKENKVKCLICNEILISNPDNASKSVSCTCGATVISGGSTHLVRKGKQYKELSSFDFTDCPDVKTDIPNLKIQS
jgi:hypothetical protein